MDISQATAFVTGANRGLGRHLASELLARGATVYAGARNPASIDLPGVTPVAIDITDPASVAAAAAATGDVNLLINNAGSATGAQLLNPDDLDKLHTEINTHFFGTLSVVRAFAPQLTARGGGSILNILSVLSWVTFPQVGGYAAAKAAEWSLTNSLRVQLAADGIRVSGLHVGYMDTDMAATVTGPKEDPAKIARLAIDGIEAGQYEIIADATSQQVLAGLAGGVGALYPSLP
ncbi:MAG TPA: SDR family oxidoreductase [Streptosporangiaceae bacterium]|jgi:NAD(P)-dependent dehydrogenase (short-subunit alcohol dehydrogenase family)